MNIKLVFTKVGYSIGEVVLTDCANLRNIVPDLAMSIYGIRDGYGYDADQVAKEWINISKYFNRLLEAHKENGINYWCIDLLLVDGFINVIFE